MKAFARTLRSQAVEIEGSRLPPPVVSYDARLGRWRLDQPYRYQDGDSLITVPAGFEFDLSSVPRPLWWLIAPFELSISAPLLHDFLYRATGSPPAGCIDPVRTYTRREVDEMFRRIMVEEGVRAWRRIAAFWAVRLFAAGAWRHPRRSGNHG